MLPNLNAAAQWLNCANAFRARLRDPPTRKDHRGVRNHLRLRCLVPRDEQP
jgi:hypothetical protein